MNTSTEIVMTISKIEAAFELAQGKTDTFKAHLHTIDNVDHHLPMIETLITKGASLLDDVEQAYRVADMTTQPRYDFNDARDDFLKLTREKINNL